MLYRAKKSSKTRYFVAAKSEQGVYNSLKSYLKHRKTPEVRHFWGILNGDPYGI